MSEGRGLTEAIQEAAERARSVGALDLLDSEVEVHEDGGVPFHLRVLRPSTAKRNGKASTHRAPRPTQRLSPPDPQLHVRDVGDRHHVVLKKRPVLQNHALIVTKDFEEQESLLTEEDIGAANHVLEETDGLLYYNAGAMAGASLRHKHMQIVHLPIGDGPQRTPVDRVVGRGSLPFVHAVASWDSRASVCFRRYRALLSAIDRDRDGAPYNLLMTRDWMLAVPRTIERFAGMSVNALSYAGSLLTRDRSELTTIKSAGPWRVLSQVAVGVG
ncbi:MAG: phosphorylase [Sandaracinaceae bacterium]